MSGPATKERRAASPLELFFDLVYVYAVAQLVGLLHHDHSPGGYLRAGVALVLVWWAWSQFTWAANATDLSPTSIRLLLLGGMAAAFFLAQTLPAAYGDAGVAFGVSYLMVRALGLLLYWVGVRDDPDHRTALRTFLPLASVAPLVAVVGGVVPVPLRIWIWAAVIVIEVAAAASAGRGEFRVIPSHFAERNGLFIILALGETIVGVGLTVAGMPVGEVWLPALVILVGVSALWWGYFDRSAPGWESGMSALHPTARGPFARDVYTLGHLPVVAGIVLFALAAEEVVVHPWEALPGPGRVALAAAVGLFHLGLMLATRRATGHWPMWALTAGVVSAVWVVATGPLAAVAVLAGVTVIVVASMALERSPAPAVH